MKHFSIHSLAPPSESKKTTESSESVGFSDAIAFNSALLKYTAKLNSMEKSKAAPVMPRQKALVSAMRLTLQPDIYN